MEAGADTASIAHAPAAASNCLDIIVISFARIASPVAGKKQNPDHPGSANAQSQPGT
jgi:hypothetical protein